MPLSGKARDQNPLALTALLVSLVPFLSALSLLSLKAGIGPKTAMYWVAEVGGVLLFGLLVIGSGLSFAALTRSKSRDWRVPTAFALLALSLVGVFLFVK